MKALLIIVILVTSLPTVEAANRQDWARAFAHSLNERKKERQREEQRQHEKDLARIYSQRGTDTIVYQQPSPLSQANQALQKLYDQRMIASTECYEKKIQASCDKLKLLKELIKDLGP